MRVFTRLAKFVTCKLLFRVRVYNEEVLDEYQTYLICPNHSSVIDPAFVFPVKYEYDIYAVAKEELFKYAWFRFLANRYNAIPINREKTDVRCMLKALNVFENNEKAKLIIFPEGKVIKTEDEVGKIYKKGAAFIAANMKKPIIPVFITRRPWLFSRVNVVYGEPFLITKNDIKGIGKIEEKTKEIIDRIYELRETK